MPFNWTVERERQMLLLAICEANLKPTMETWSIVAKILGENITPSAVRWDASCRLSLQFRFCLPLPSTNAYPCPSSYILGRRTSAGVWACATADFSLARNITNSKESPTSLLVPRLQL